jgi:hypothetical protein
MGIPFAQSITANQRNMFYGMKGEGDKKIAESDMGAPSA